VGWKERLLMYREGEYVFPQILGSNVEKEGCEADKMAMKA
jgi:hypothetical protein